MEYPGAHSSSRYVTLQINLIDRKKEWTNIGKAIRQSRGRESKILILSLKAANKY